MTFYMKPPFSMTGHEIEKHRDKKTRAHGETLNKQYNHDIVESRIAWKWANSPTPDKNVGQKLFQWATINRVRSEKRKSTCWPILF